MMSANIWVLVVGSSSLLFCLKFPVVEPCKFLYNSWWKQSRVSDKVTHKATRSICHSWTLLFHWRYCKPSEDLLAWCCTGLGRAVQSVCNHHYYPSNTICPSLLVQGAGLASVSNSNILSMLSSLRIVVSCSSCEGEWGQKWSMLLSGWCHSSKSS